MTRYYIRPADLSKRSQAWAPTLAQAQQMQARLQEASGIKWIITKKEIEYDSSV